MGKGVTSMNRWYVYVDDERKFDSHTNAQYLWSCYVHGLSVPITCRSYNVAIDCLEELRAHGDEVVLDLDHDLGEGKSGYDLCKWVVENEYPLCGFHLHTMNPVGKFNMHHLLTHYGYQEF